MKTSIGNIEQKKLTDQVAGKLANWILKYQELFTKMLSVRTNHWSLKQQWIFLCLICIFLGGASILAMVQSFRVNPTDTVAISATSSVSLKPLTNEAPAIITREEFEAAKQYMAEHPDLHTELPDLFKRLSFIEETYYSQNKK